MVHDRSEAPGSGDPAIAPWKRMRFWIAGALAGLVAFRLAVTADWPVVATWIVAVLAAYWRWSGIRRWTSRWFSWEPSVNVGGGLGRARPWLPTIGWLIGGLWTGWLVGTPLGQGLRFNVDESEGWGALFLFLGVLVAVAVLGLEAAVRRSWGLAIGLAGFLGACSVFGALAPPPLGAHYTEPGTATVGTRSDPAAQWSGDVRCRWTEGDPTVVSVELRSSPRRPLAPAGLVGPPPSDLGAYRAEFTRLNLRSVPTSGHAIVGWEYATFGSDTWYVDLEVLEVADNGQTGSVDVGVDGLVISWTCRRGP